MTRWMAVAAIGLLASGCAMEATDVNGDDETLPFAARNTAAQKRVMGEQEVAETMNPLLQRDFFVNGRMNTRCDKPTIDFNRREVPPQVDPIEHPTR